MTEGGYRLERAADGGFDLVAPPAPSFGRIAGDGIPPAAVPDAPELERRSIQAGARPGDYALICRQMR